MGDRVRDLGAELGEAWVGGCLDVLNLRLRSEI